MINNLVIEGRLTRDAEIKDYGNGRLANISIANNEKIKGEDVTYFFDCIGFGKTAELIQKHTYKGQRVVIEGKLTIDRWENKNGETRRKAKIIISKIHFMEWKQGIKKQEDFETNNFYD